MTPDPVRGEVETVPDGPEYDLDFREYLDRVREDDSYREAKNRHREQYDSDG